jgi:hypothetical protein
MSQNPFQQNPFGPGASGGWAPDKSAGDPGAQAALRRVSPPAVAIMATMAISMMLAIGNLVLNQMGVLGPAQIPPEIDGATRAQLEQMYASLGMVSTAATVISLLSGAFIIFAMTKMKRLESYGLSITATIMSMVPCISPCCILGLPFGIWGLIVLMDESVKRYFR